MKLYPILINSGLLEQSSKWMPKEFNRIVIITDNFVKKHYAASLEHALKKQGFIVLVVSFSAGEKFKNNSTKCKIEEKMLRHHCGRDTLILALGGGVVGDLAGFVAATYMRGIPYIQIPTTLLAMVDSSIGGKTGIDTPYGKNLIGAFWQPQAVIADIDCLSTLSKQHIINGLIEALKMFLTSDINSLNYLQKNIKKTLEYDKKTLKNIVTRATKIKYSIIQKDERETNLRMVLNFGHTIGHALEHVSQYKLLHGYAVAYGILVEAKISQLMGILEKKDFIIIESILYNLGIKKNYLKKFNINQIIQKIKVDKKSKAGQARYILLSHLGKVYEKDSHFSHIVSENIIKKAFLGE